MAITKQLSTEKQSAILEKLKLRFEQNKHRHSSIKWIEVQNRLETNTEKLQTLDEMESTGGEPDVVGKDEKTGEFLIYDCSKESPEGRRSICYDKAALLGRKKYPPKNNVEEMAKEIGIELLSEVQYRYLQTLGNFDTKTSSWIKTPDKIRKLGGALFGDYRYETVFIYHNGADSYYGARGFRGCLRI
ncbi:DUF4256 domain-containing protein [Marivirga sp.]|uniref:DUF4256 domain-containing protein n=1 Tax=Marivirga sp. TaxID=2018662 RepID=UPI002D80DE14|nr:DUF4256 domain-containing protein [Marivirga sp.]HET8859121.1 DUF4256 domain-containing protein [Marivirga sp.]